MGEKRRIHRYENLPAPLDDPLYAVIPDQLVLTPPPPPAAAVIPEDLFGLVPFDALTPQWSSSDPPRGQLKFISFLIVEI